MKLTPILVAGIAAIATIASSNALVHADLVNDTTNATVNVEATKDDNKLYLQSAPDFHFDKVSVADVYKGFDRSQTGTNDLTIIDTRAADRTDAWQLDVTMKPFAEGTDILSRADMNLTTSATPKFEFVSPKLNTTETINLAKATENRGTLTLAGKDIKAELVQQATPTAKAKDGSKYSADLVWTLTPTLKTAAAL